MSSGSAPRLIGIAAVVAAVALGVVFASRFGTDPGAVHSPLVGKAAPAFELATLDGTRRVALADFSERVVVINFWASWCVGCRQEHSSLLATAGAYQAKGVQFIGVDYQDTVDAGNAFLDELGRSENTLYLSDENSQTAIAYGVRGIPETFVIGDDGKVAAVLIGPIDALKLSATIDLVLAGHQPGGEVVGTIQEGPTSG